MSDLIRVTGMISGMDTESIISAYTSTAKTKLQKAKNSKTLNTWTQEKWKTVNSKIYSFYSKTLSTNRMSAAYKKQKTTTSNSALSVVAGSSAVEGVQTAQIKNTAKAGYLTGGKIDISSTSASLASELGIAEGSSFELEIGEAGNTTTTKIQIGGTAASDDVKVVNNMNDLVSELKKAGVNANFDVDNKRLFVSAKSTGEAKDFRLKASDEDGLAALSKMGLATEKQIDDHFGTDTAAAAAFKTANNANGFATKIDGSKAKLVLNGAEFESDSNTFTINGSTYTINSMPTDPNEEISVTTAVDYDAMYGVVKDMLKEYNELVNELSKVYNADSSKGYEPLSDEQKEALSEKEVEDWENKIKDALLRKDSTVNEVIQAMSSVTTEGFEVNGRTMYLSDFGISTQDFFAADKNERYALHIDGDADDEVSNANEDKLKSMIASNPEDVMGFFQKFADKLYNNLYKKMSGNSRLSSIYKVYNDKQLATEATDWDKKIADLEQKLSDIEDKWYKKFSKMETTLSKLQKNQNAVGGYLGMN